MFSSDHLGAPFVFRNLATADATSGRSGTESGPAGEPATGPSPGPSFLEVWFALLRQGNVRAICVLLGLLVVLTFLPSIQNGFVNFDDPDYAYENLHVQRGLTWEG